MMPNNRTFDRVQNLRPGRSVFDLSYAKKMSGKMGYLYPMMCDEVVPGDVFEIGAEAVIRFAPMVAPVLHEIILKADWFFVPYRILYTKSDSSVDGMTDWEKFITGGQNGTDATVLPRSAYAAPAEGSLLDHFGFPPGLTLTGDDQPLSFPVVAYNTIYNNYYRDENLEAMRVYNNQALALANWDADYFTRAMPWQQRGTAPALPISGTTHAIFDPNNFAAPGALVATTLYADNNIVNRLGAAAGGPTAAQLKAIFDNNAVDLSGASTFNVADIRLAVQLQRWMERNARSGARYTEFLKAHFGVAPRDERLDRPEYIGGVRQPVVISEVLQTSETATTPQGNLAGHGIMAGRHYVGKYHAQEYGLIMCVMSVIPRTAYQQGINRQWTRVSKFDFYHPEFANLSEQGIQNQEIYAVNSAGGNNRAVWGYQGRYDEMRSKNDQVAGAFRSTLDYWHLGRIFGSFPFLNSTFGHVDPATVTRIFAVPAADHLYVHWGNRVKAIRPLPVQSNPGRMDHDYGGY